MIIAVFPGLAGRMPRPGLWLVTVKRLLSVGLFGTALWLISIMLTLTSDDTQSHGQWQPWSEATIEQLVDDGQVVFVDVTAAWCLTCKANKALVLDTDTMAETFAAQNVTLLRADWTKPDAAISAYLAQHDRFGIPFNIVYGPSAPDGITLPELLTFNAIPQP